MPLFIFIVIILLTLFGFAILRERLLHGRIKRQVAMIGGTVTQISRHAPSAGPISNQQDIHLAYASAQRSQSSSYYLVDILDADGKQRVRLCKLSLLGGFFWVDQQRP